MCGLCGGGGCRLGRELGGGVGGLGGVLGGGRIG